jgi:hypothetical protein
VTLACARSTPATLASDFVCQRFSKLTRAVVGAGQHILAKLIAHSPADESLRADSIRVGNDARRKYEDAARLDERRLAQNPNDARAKA